MLDDNSIDCCITSPPYYGLRDYGVDNQIGLEESPEEYVKQLVNVFREVKRVLKPEGTLWLNLGDSYAGSGKGQWEQGKGQKETYIPTKDSPQCSIQKTPGDLKPKDLVGIPWMVAFALRADGWYLRQDIIWHKPNPMPESVTDRCTKSHEYIFLLSKSERYFYDHEAIKEDTVYPVGSRPDKKKGDFKGKYHAHEDFKHISDSFRAIRDKRNKRSVWTITTKPFRGAHFATFPEKLIEPCILAGCPEGGIVLDPFIGAGTTAVVAWKNNRNYLGFELNPEYVKIATKRLSDTVKQVSIL